VIEEAHLRGVNTHRRTERKKGRIILIPQVFDHNIHSTIVPTTFTELFGHGLDWFMQCTILNYWARSKVVIQKYVIIKVELA
jgi:hypothetical protein